MVKLLGIAAVGIALCALSAFAAQGNTDKPDPEMLRMMEYLKDWELIRNMELLRNLQRLEADSKAGTIPPPVNTPAPAKKESPR